jgi:hypothetical protein
VYIGSGLCSDVTIADDPASLTCILGPGTGLVVNIFAKNGNKSSEAKPWLGYARPSITSLSSAICSQSKDNALVLVNCARTGGLITIEGQNFGSSGLVIVIGPSLCLDPSTSTAVSSTVSTVSCTLPVGVGFGTYIMVTRSSIYLFFIVIIDMDTHHDLIEISYF